MSEWSMWRMNDDKIYLKEDVDLNGIDLGIVEVLPTICFVLNNFGSPLVLTSGLDGTHMENSLHYEGKAIDVRIWYIEGNEDVVVSKLEEKLPDYFDVVLEPTHIHIELDD